MLQNGKNLKYKNKKCIFSTKSHLRTYKWY